MSDVIAINQLVEKHEQLKQEIAKVIVGQDAVIDMSSLEDGIYLARVTIQGNSEIIKILKQ